MTNNDVLRLTIDNNVADPMTLRRVFGHYPAGVVAIAAVVDGEDTVLVSSSFMVGISLDPPLVTFAVQHTSQSWPRLAKAERLGVSVLADGQGQLCRQLSSKDRETRFDGVGTINHDNALLIEDAASWMVCTVEDTVRAGDHDIVVLRLEATATDHERDPLVFHSSMFRPLAERPAN